MTSLTDIEQRTLHLVEYGKQLNPARDWLVLLIISGVLLIASAVVNIFIFVGVRNGPGEATLTSGAPTIDANTVSSIEAVFKKRASEQGNYEHVYEFVDPSK
jgi:hypothetical protein